MCVCWSPDGKYIVTGGQDDLVSIWSLAERRIVARCAGHHSWVTAVAFDPWRCDGKNYRFGSVGEDTRLALWDFSLGTLHRPKGVCQDLPDGTWLAGLITIMRQTSVRPHARGNSISSNVHRHRAESQSTNLLRTETTRSVQDSEDRESVVHDVESRTTVAQLPPIFISKLVYKEPTEEDKKKDSDAEVSRPR